MFFATIIYTYRVRLREDSHAGARHEALGRQNRGALCAAVVVGLAIRLHRCKQKESIEYFRKYTVKSAPFSVVDHACVQAVARQRVTAYVALGDMHVVTAKNKATDDRQARLTHLIARPSIHERSVGSAGAVAGHFQGIIVDVLVDAKAVVEDANGRARPAAPALALIVDGHAATPPGRSEIEELGEVAGLPRGRGKK